MTGTARPTFRVLYRELVAAWRAGGFGTGGDVRQETGDRGVAVGSGSRQWRQQESLTEAQRRGKGRQWQYAVCSMQYALPMLSFTISAGG